MATYDVVGNVDLRTEWHSVSVRARLRTRQGRTISRIGSMKHRDHGARGGASCFRNVCGLVARQEGKRRRVPSRACTRYAPGPAQVAET